jgi:ubiquinone/menaquinone biosynthesis C-methylase UbiE
VSSLTPADWRRRFLEQAAWTHSLRQYLYSRANLSGARRILDAGCGAGAITSEISQMFTGRVIGLDLMGDRLNLAQSSAPQADFIQGNATALPFPAATFDISLCHFLLLWLAEPLAALREMARVTCPGGAILALAEPDYGGRIDYPEELAQVGLLQAEALKRQGADPHTGRKLSGLFHRAGLVDVETGLLGGQWNSPPSAAAWQSEWEVIASDLQHQLSSQELDHLRSLDQAAWQTGERVLFVPTFYAWARVP